MTPRQALLLGNAVRQQRKELRRQLQRRDIHVCDVLANPPACAGNMRLFDLLDRAPSPNSYRRDGSLATYHTRQTKVWIRHLNMRAALANVNLFSEIDDLTPRARAWLVAELRRLYRLPMTAEDYALLERRPFPSGSPALLIIAEQEAKAA